MSTVPGRESWQDAGLVRPDLAEPVNLVEESEDPNVPDAGEDYRPGTPRPDRDDRAEEADVLDQAVRVPVEDNEDDTEE